MTARDTDYTFELVSIELADAAFQFHTSVAESDAHIYPRTRDELEEMAEEGLLFWARSGDDVVGLCYAKLEDRSWEVGGLTVPRCEQGNGIGAALMQMALAHTLVMHDPWAYKQRVIAHVHVANDAPRPLLAALGFIKCGTTTLAGHLAPASMKKNAAGDVEGDELEFTREQGLPALLAKLKVLNHRAKNGGAHLDFGPMLGDLEQVMAVLVTMSEQRSE